MMSYYELFISNFPFWLLLVAVSLILTFVSYGAGPFLFFLGLGWRRTPIFMIAMLNISKM